MLSVESESDEDEGQALGCARVFGVLSDSARLNLKNIRQFSLSIIQGFALIVNRFKAINLRAALHPNCLWFTFIVVYL